MENCLVTKLKATVNDESLETLGWLKFNVFPVGNTPGRPELGFYIGVRAKESSVKLRVTDGNIYNISGVSQGNEFTVNTSDTITYLYLPNLECSLFVEKYKIGSLNMVKNALEGNILSTYYSSLYVIYGTGWKGKISDANQDTITTINLNGNNYVEQCSLDDFLPFKKLTTLRVPVSFIGGDIESLGEHTELTELGVKYCDGDISKLVASQVVNERTSCSGILCIQLGTNTSHNSVTFNGSVYATSGDVTLKWRETTSSVSGAVTDVQLASTAITIDADGNKVDDATPW